MANVHVTMHDEEHKLCGMQSVNTSVKCNPICIARIRKAMEENDDKCICISCFADYQLNYKASLQRALTENTRILTSHDLTDEEIASINLYTRFVRIESFGDVQNVTQAKNYIRIMYANPDIGFGVWTKNYGIWFMAFNALGKPENCSFVVSSVHLNKIDSFPAKYERYVDHVFTVYDVEDYDALETSEDYTLCAGIQCKACGYKCYKKNTPRNVFEKIRGKKNRHKMPELKPF